MNWILSRSTVLVCCVLASSWTAAQEIKEPGDYTRSLQVDSLERTFLIHVPPGYDRSTPAPLVLVYHGGGSNAEDWQKYCDMNTCSDKHGFICVYPNGTGHVVENFRIFGWNGGTHRPGGDDPKSLAVDDVKFTAAMLDELQNNLKIDSSRVYATGMSMGAIMIYRLASELSDRFAAIAPIAGAMGEKTCKPNTPVSIVHFHGTEDPAVPLEGGKGKIDPSGADYISVEQTIAAWVAANHCDTKASETKLPDTVDDGTTLIKQVYANGNDGSEVQLYKIGGGGHTWPGRDFAPELAVLGKSSKDISANEVIWEFFSKHRKPIK